MSDTPKKDLTNIFELTQNQSNEPTETTPVELSPLADPIIDALPPVSPEMQEALGESTQPEFSNDVTAPIAPDPDATEKFMMEETPPAIATGTMADIKEFSEKVTTAAPLEAQTPFSLLIRGKLQKHEQEKLLSILSRANIGLREVELEPQFEAGNILIPRISEYLGVMIVQALRDSQTDMLLGPAEYIFSNEHTLDSSTELQEKSPDVFYDSTAPKRAYELIPLTSDRHFNHMPQAEEFDTIHTSLALKHSDVHSARADGLNEAIEVAKKQLKALAFHQKAKGITQFSYQLIPLAGDPPGYKLIAQGILVTFK